jgi:Flp pilus assembly protein TadD
LPISSTIALALLVVHSWRTRGRDLTLAFFISALAFGILRGNAIWLLCKLLGGTDQGLLPYLPQGGFLPDIGHSSIQVAAGWVFSMYLAWTVSELILHRLPRFSGRLFMVAGISSFFLLAICLCMETTAVSVGWWYWSLPTRSGLFGNVNTWAMEGWFSVIPDFLLPFLVIACSAPKHPRRRWLWCLVFPLHILGHLSGKWFPHPHVIYNLLELLVVSLAMFGSLSMVRGEIKEPPPSRTRGAQPLLAAALGILFAVLIVANLRGRGGMEAQWSWVPLLLLCLLAWKRISLRLVFVLSLATLAGWHWIGARALYGMAPIGLFGFLYLYHQRPAALVWKLVPPLATLALAATALVADETDRGRVEQFAREWRRGDKMILAGRVDQAEAAWAEADRFRPRNTYYFYSIIEQMMQSNLEVKQQVVLFQHRVGQVLKELEEVVRRDPEMVEPRSALGRLYLTQGDLPAALRQYRNWSDLRPQDATAATMLGYLLLRVGNLGEAEAVCTRVSLLRAPTAEGLSNLGVIRFVNRRDQEAAALWERALALKPGLTAARLNLERLKDETAVREVDPRFLARTDTGRDLASWTYFLAALGEYATGEKLRLYLEATQFDPDYLAPHINLAFIYLDAQAGFHDPVRALWHAQRAVTLSASDETRAQSLLLLGRALLDNGRPDQAHSALLQGRAIAPDRLLLEYDRYLRGSSSPDKPH